MNLLGTHIPLKGRDFRGKKFSRNLISRFRLKNLRISQEFNIEFNFAVEQYITLREEIICERNICGRDFCGCKFQDGLNLRKDFLWILKLKQKCFSHNRVCNKEKIQFYETTCF